jgi:glycolate oxidase FAD binding subunit
VAIVEQHTCRIDDCGPFPVRRPTSAAELGELVRQAGAEGQALYPLGGRTALGIGRPPSRPGWGIDVRGLAEVIDYPARDMTITVQAGITLARLQELLATEGQRLPIDVPRPELATLGGAMAVNASGPRRYGMGTLRDYVLGISTVNDAGLEVKAGGRVVKNVAGYDLCKLHIGALGTLGIITQVTLKLRPAPETRAFVLLGSSADSLPQLLDRLHRSRTRPVCLDVLNAAAARALSAESGIVFPGAAWVVGAGFEDQEPTVRWQMQQLIQEIAGTDIDGLEAYAGKATEPLWHALTEMTAPSSAELSFKANVLPSAVAEVARQAELLAPDSLLYAHAGSGIVRGHLAGLTQERAAAMVKGLLECAVEARGNLVLTQAPPAWKKTLPVWGQPRNDGWLMGQVKEKLDPRRLFNPGRFAEGIG